jgi:Ca2+-binding EF-hand superfamily protein
MKNTLKLALAVATLTVIATSSQAKMRHGGGEGKMGFASLEQLDSDKSGDVTFDEFKKSSNERFLLADSNKDGKVTVEEMTAVIEKVRLEKMAKHFVDRFDTDRDGAVTLAEMEANKQEVYAVLDRDNDGKLTKNEIDHKMKKGWFGRYSSHRSDGAN